MSRVSVLKENTTLVNKLQSSFIKQYTLYQEYKQFKSLSALFNLKSSKAYK